MRQPVQSKQPQPRRQLTCPNCKRPLRTSKGRAALLPKFFPFCCERCKLVDLGAWLDAEYRIPARPDDESDEALTGDLGDPEAAI